MYIERKWRGVAWVQLWEGDGGGDTGFPEGIQSKLKGDGMGGVVSFLLLPSLSLHLSLSLSLSFSFPFLIVTIPDGGGGVCLRDLLAIPLSTSVSKFLNRTGSIAAGLLKSSPCRLSIYAQNMIANTNQPNIAQDDFNGPVHRLWKYANSTMRYYVIWTWFLRVIQRGISWFCKKSLRLCG